MNPAEVTVQTFLHLTCINCEENRPFKVADSDKENMTAVYKCQACNHEVKLDLNPVA